MGFFDLDNEGAPPGELGGGGFFGAPEAETERLQKLQKQVADNTALFEVAGIPWPDAKPSPLERISDLLLRGNYATAAFVDSLLVDNEGIGNAFGSAFRELASGIGGIQGEKLLFGDVLKKAGLPEGPGLSDALPFLYNTTGRGWRLKKGGVLDANARGALGFVLDVAADPLTYVSFGTGRAATQILRQGGKISRKVPLTKQGLERLATEMADLLPRARKEALEEFAKKQGITAKELERTLDLPPVLKDLTDEVLTDRVRRLSKLEGGELGVQIAEVNLAATETAREAALHRVVKVAATGTTPGLIDPGGMKFFGRTIVSSEKFKRAAQPITRFLRAASEMPVGRQIMEGVKQLDTVFNETLKAARRVPAWIQKKSAARAAIRQANSNLETGLRELFPKGWKKETVTAPDGRKMPIAQYIFHHIDNPAKYPANRMPGPAVEVAQQLGRTMAEWGAEEVAFGIMDPRHLRRNYIYHVFDNTPEEIAQLSEAYVATPAGAAFARSLAGNTGFAEARVFPTMDDAIEFAQRLKAEGKIDFELRPILDAEEAMRRRGVAHNQAVGIERFIADTISDYGLSKQDVARETFKRVMPEIDNLVARRTEDLVEELGGAAATVTRGPRVKEKLPRQLHLFKSNEPPKSAKVRDRKQLLMWEDLNDEVTLKVGDLLAEGLHGRYGTAGQRIDLRGLSPQEQALYWFGRLRAANSLQEVDRLLRNKKIRELLAASAPGIDDTILDAIGLSRRKYLDSFGTPYRAIKRGPFEGLWMPEGLADDLERMKTAVLNDKEVGFMLRVYDNLTNIFKMGVTSVWPAFHIRNSYSNVAQNFVDMGVSALDPVRAGRIVDLMLGRDGTLATKLGRYTYDEIRVLARRHGLLISANDLLEKVVHGQRRNTIADRIVGNPFARAGQATGEAIENHARLLNFVTWLERGMDPVEAAARTNRVLFDYGQLSPVERDIFRRLFPFWIWTKKNIALQARMLAQEPGRVAAAIKPVAGSFRDRGPDREMLPEYLAGDFRVKALDMLGNAQVLTGIDLPFGGAVQQIFGREAGGFDQVLRTNLSSLNPLLTSIVELGMNKNFFTGRDLTERENLKFWGQAVDKLPRPVQEWLDFRREVGPDGQTRYTTNGLKAYLLMKSWALSRAYTTFRTLPLGDQDADWASWLTDFLTGADIREFDLAEQEERALRNMLRRQDEMLLRKGVKRSFTRAFLPKESELRPEWEQRREAPEGGFFQ